MMDSCISEVTFGICNLCLTEGTVRSMLIPYKNNEETEIFSELLVKCYCIDLSKHNLGDTKKLICDTCVSRLRDATQFREQVENSLQTLSAFSDIKVSATKKSSEGVWLDDYFSFNSTSPVKNDVKDEPATALAFFLNDSLSPGHASDGNDVKDEPTTTLDFCLSLEHVADGNVSDGAQQIKTETHVLRPTDKMRAKKSSHRRKRDLKNTDKLIKSGLFPFKMSQNNKKPFSCAVCSLKYVNLDDIRLHSLTHSIKAIDLAFNKLMFSKQQYHKVDDKLRCKICTTDITDFEHLKTHLENCTRMKTGSLKWSNLPFKLEKDQLDCPICKKKFVNFVTLNSHMNEHFPNFVCENCGKAYASKARLRGHIRTHEVGEFPCKYCEQVFDIVTKREHHVSKEHKSGIRYACKRCNISLSSFYARQKHLAEVHNEDLKRYKCKACPQSYITPGHLSAHVRRDHLNERNHQCNKCDLAFYTKNALKMHLIKHDGERIHTCNVCQKSYQRKKTLIEHLRIHNNDKRFVCPVCGRAFTQKCTLKGHMRVHERKYVLMT